jgi:ParB/RepB/Spo0J family partition protein
MVELRSNRRNLISLDPSDVKPSKHNPRGRDEFKKPALAKLRRSVEKHGVLQPIIVSRAGPDGYRLVEGERRWRVATDLGLPRIPAYVIEELPPNDEMVAMYQIHMQRAAWGPADEFRAIRELRAADPDASVGQLVDELGIAPQTLRNRLRVLELFPDIATAVEDGELGFTAALRSVEVAEALRRERPGVVSKLGGEGAVARHLVEKAKWRRGVGPELVRARKYLLDRHATSDASVKRYITNPKATDEELFGGSSRRPAGKPRTTASSSMASSTNGDGGDLILAVRGLRQKIRAVSANDISASRRAALLSELQLLYEAGESLERALLDVD